MKTLLVRLMRQSPAMIVAMLALFVALTGTAVATTSALVTGKQIKNSSITGLDVKNKSLTPKDFKGSVRGPRGLRGIQGIQGPPGAPNPNAANSELLDGKDSTAFVENSGVILVSAGSSEWSPFNSTDPLTVSYSRNAANFTRGGPYPADSFIRIDAQAPVAQYGKALRFLGAEICYSASASSIIEGVFIDLPRFTASGIGSTNNQISDATDRTDDACRLFLDPTPVVLTDEDSVGAMLDVNWTAGSAFFLGRATFIFEPTSTAASPPTP